MGKLPLAIKTAATIKRFAGDLKDVWPLGEVRVWRFAGTLSTPFGKDMEGKGAAFLSALETWLAERRDDGARAILLSDGLFEDFDRIKKLAAMLKNSPNLHLEAVGIGADRDMRILAMLSSEGNPWDLCDVEAAIIRVSASTLCEGGLEETLAEFQSDEDDEII